MNDLSTEAARRRAIAWATALAANTPLEPQAYEQGLLDEYAVGALSLEQVLRLLDERVKHVLYRSRATQAFREEALSELLAEARAWNEQHGITGLLCYSDRQFVQLLEGTAAQVDLLYARIQRDPRHRQVTTLSTAYDAQRFFADWQMAFITAEEGEFHWVLTSLQQTTHSASLAEQYVRDSHLRTLLEAFSQA
ncbi:BLUF domain-containing protein [Hymenobacter sp. GOD-10R]|uniref:BLUF domain-containing protein n=1 Tax=Hymenobacter sp. GOD-10R TaxID=3093922 RepID=UPI002D781EBB|nr:BLUF domain-containing protein [Hymenobacter sp. GOD-10R]WRQ31576.1 BLUF domain-containing protein [Hymenobacter sp. GOD-10R]